MQTADVADLEAPGARYQCACLAFDGWACLQMRYGAENCSGNRERCCCVCHHVEDAEEE